MVLPSSNRTWSLADSQSVPIVRPIHTEQSTKQAALLSSSPQLASTPPMRVHNEASSDYKLDVRLPQDPCSEMMITVTAKKGFHLSVVVDIWHGTINSE